MEVTQSVHPKTWRKEVECPRCGSYLKISWKDISILTTRKRTLSSYKQHILHYYIKCSKCGCRIELSEENLPYLIKKKVYNNMDIVDRMLNFYFS